MKSLARAAMVAEVPQLDGVEISPDGAWVTYAVTRRSVTTNERHTEQRLQRVPRAGEAAAKPVILTLPKGAVAVQSMLLFGGKKQPPFGPYGASIPNPLVNGIPFYNGLRRFDVPAALLIYDEGHVFERPAAIADSLTRTAEWLDYWVRGMPFPDPIRAKEYGHSWATHAGSRILKPTS